MLNNYINKIDKGWDLAVSLRGEKDFNNSASRMYYSVFQAVKFYVIRKENYDSEKAREKKQKPHDFMRRVVKEKTKKNKLPLDVYERLRVLRNKADYDPDDVTESELDLQIVNGAQDIKNFFLKKAQQ